MSTSGISTSPQGTGVSPSSAAPEGNIGSTNASAKTLYPGSSATSSQGKESDAAEKGAAAAGTTSTASSDVQPQEGRPRQPWNKDDPKPEGWSYTPFYGKKRGTPHLEKESEYNASVHLNWVARLPQDAETKEVDQHAARSLEMVMTFVAQHLGFTYVWIVHNPRKPTPTIADGGASGTNAWSVGACFGSDAEHRVVYGNIFVSVHADNSRVVTGVLPVAEQGDVLAGRRTYDLYLADDTEGAADIPRPFASRETPKPNKKAKGGNGGGLDIGGKQKVVVPAGKAGKSKALKANPKVAGGVTKKTNRGKKVKGKNTADDDDDDDDVMEENNTILLINSTNFKLESFRGKVTMESR